MEYNYCREGRDKVFHYVPLGRHGFPEEFQMKVLLTISPDALARPPYPNMFTGEFGSVMPGRFISTVFRSGMRIRGFNIQDDVSFGSGEARRGAITPAMPAFVHFQRVFVIQSSFPNRLLRRYCHHSDEFRADGSRYMSLAPRLFACLYAYIPFVSAYI